MNSKVKLPNTFGIKSAARAKSIISCEEELVEICNLAGSKHDFLVLGEGSNILPNDFVNRHLIIIAMDETNVQLTDGCALVSVGAGMNWHKFVIQCAETGYHGLENLALIPGTVGAAPVQNIGAYGVEQDEFFYSLRGFDLRDAKFVVMNNSDCDFAYRDSVFKQELKDNFIITKVTYKLKLKFDPVLDYGGVNEYIKTQYPTNLSATQLAEAISYIRRSKLPYPDQIGNAGSFFKNPIVHQEGLNAIKAIDPDVRFFNFGRNFKLSAAWLIDKCGWKGYRAGDAGVYENHALILVNHGDATGGELFDLSQKIIDSVVKKYGVGLEREVNLLGFD